jgi:plastocyanin
MSAPGVMRPARPFRPAIACIAFLLGLTFAMAGCSDPPTAAQRPEQDGEGRYVIAMTSDLTFEPAVASVPVGATVVWVNVADSVVHDVAGYRGDPIEEDREEFSSFRQPPEGLGRPIGPGGNFTHTFGEKGDWTIWCHTHHEQDMKGVIRVG